MREFELSHSMVHYLLTIHKLKEGKGYARVTDIAKDLGLTKGSVSTAVNNLKKRNLVIEEEDSKFLLLTDEGHHEVHHILTARTLLFYFLRDFVGVSSGAAAHDSCQMEHLMGPETTEKFFHFMRELSCDCDDKEEGKGKLRNFKTALDLCSFPTAEDFFHSQEGDYHLPFEE